MGQPGMRVTVDAAMRARDVSRPWPDADPADRPRAADAAPPSPERARWQGPVPQNGPDRTQAADSADRRTDSTAGRRTDSANGEPHDGGGRAQEDRSQRERRGKADRRRLGKRHARARR